MPDTTEISLPDIGDFDSVEVVEVPIAVGDRVEKESTLLTLESDKATMVIPSPAAGVVKELLIQEGDQVKTGSPIVLLEQSPEAVTADDNADNTQDDKPADTSSKPKPSVSADTNTEVVVLGAGPGGYTAAFRAADLGKNVTLIERYPVLGGVCLNVGCIPSKALLHVAKVISEIDELKSVGIDLGNHSVDEKPVRLWTESVINKLTSGLSHMAKQRKVTVVHGTGKFSSANTIEVSSEEGTQTIAFEQAIIAAGSQPTSIPGWPDDPRIMNSTGALKLHGIPKRLLVVGGGIIGLEMATVYQALGSEITVVEMLDGLMAGADKDLVRSFQKHVSKLFKHIYLKTAVKSVTPCDDYLTVEFDGPKAPESVQFDAILLAIGRTPNGHLINADKAGVNVDERGFIAVDTQQHTNVNHIFAIGDVVGQPMLAHKATHEGKVAAEVIAGLKSGFDASVIPSVAYTDPEVAWVGVTETQAKEQGIKYGKGVFPWAASGRSLSLGRDEGITKILFQPESKRIIGAGIVGPNAGDLIAEAALAIEMGCDAEDIGLTIHPHPTLSETVAMAAEAFEGTITDLYIPKR